MKIIILDRDGVINEDSDEYIKSVEEWQPIAGSLEAIARLNHAGYRVVVATNQSGLARGLFTIHALNAMHSKMQKELSRYGGHVDAVFFCPHAPEESCSCRKPQPGMLQDIAKRFHLSLNRVPMIGDSLRDVEAARAVDGAPVLVLTGKGKRARDEAGESLKRVPIFRDLAEAVDSLLGNG